MGSFGGSSSKAADEANQLQQQRDASIQKSVAAISSAFNSPERQQQYNDYYNKLNNYYTGQVNDQESTAARNLKFAQARSGLSGGSAAVDSNAQLNKDYTKGLINASQTATAGRASLEQSDINSENTLTSLAQQGNYTGAIPQEVAQAQQANLGVASNLNNAQSLQNLFSGTAGIYNNEQTAAALRKSQQSPLGSLYGTSNSYTGTG